MLLDFSRTPKLPIWFAAQPDSFVSQTLHWVQFRSTRCWHRSEQNAYQRGDHDGHDRGKSRRGDAVLGAFETVLTLKEHDKEKLVCPHCGSKNVEQEAAAFFAVTGKKS
jgi:hypothetical protein